MDSVMKTLLLFAGVGLVLGGSVLLANGPATRCYENEANRSFSTDSVIALGSEVKEKMPAVEWDEGRKSAEIKWVPLGTNYSVEVEEIGVFRGKGIFRVRYLPRPGAPNTDVPSVMFGFEDTTQDESAGIRPFYISAGDPPLSLESRFISDENRPFSLGITVDVPGSGKMWSRFEFGFSSGGARLLEFTSGGRKQFAKTLYYDKSGKVVKTVTEDKN